MVVYKVMFGYEEYGSLYATRENAQEVADHMNQNFGLEERVRWEVEEVRVHGTPQIYQMTPVDYDLVQLFVSEASAQAVADEMNSDADASWGIEDLYMVRSIEVKE